MITSEFYNMIISIIIIIIKLSIHTFNVGIYKYFYIKYKLKI